MTETDVTSATTKNMAGHQPPQFADQQSSGQASGSQASGYAPGYTPGGWAEQQTPGTAPFYQAPMAAQYQQQLVEQKKSFSWGKWILLSFMTFLLFAVLAGGALFWWGKKAIERAIEKESGFNEPVVVNMPPIPGVPLPSAGDSAAEPVSVNLDSLKYPGSVVIEAKKAPFAETVSMTTGDDLETVKQYYDKKFGETFKNSATNIQSQDDEKFVYVALSHPMVTIEIEPDAKQQDKTRISIAKVAAPIPQKLKELLRNQVP